MTIIDERNNKKILFYILKREEIMRKMRDA